MLILLESGLPGQMANFSILLVIFLSFNEESQHHIQA